MAVARGVGGFVRIDQDPWRAWGVGKLVRVEGRDATVRFFDCPDASDPPHVSVTVDKIVPVNLATQTRVYRLDVLTSRWQVGRVLDGEGQTVLVQFPNKKIVNLDAEGLEVRWRRKLRDPMTFLVRQVTETPRFSDARSEFIKAMTAQRAASLGMSALLSSNIQLTDYQYKVIKQVLQDPVQRYLLADEVGLGKTVEAGVLIRQFILDNPKSANVLVIAPSALNAQWRSELVRKFNLDAWMDDTLNVVASDDIVEVSRLLSDAQMLVIDEAHHLSKETSAGHASLFEMVRARAPSLKALLLLSATPALADTTGFLRMLHLLDPVAFAIDDIAAFEHRIESRQLVAEVVSRLVPENLLMMEDDLDRLQSEFSGDVQLQAQIEELRSIVQLLPDEEDENFLRALEAVRVHVAETYKLHRRVLRNRRRSFPWATPSRSGLRTVTFTCEEEANSCTAIEDLRLELVNEDGTLGLAEELLHFAVQPSTPCSLAETIRLRGIGTEEHWKHAARIDALSKQAREAERRLEALNREVSDLLRRTPQVQVAVFCDRAETADAVFDSLQALLRNKVVRHQVHDVDSMEEFELNIAPLAEDDWGRFMSQPNDCRVIVCDASAEEGLNLHGGRKVVVHYDLPTSPNRVEQRMGRFDRFGSGSAVESVALVCASNPVEAAWVRCLDAGFQVFGQSLASFQYLVDEAMRSFGAEWMTRGTMAFDELQRSLSGATGKMAREKRRIDQQDSLEAMSTAQDDSFDELEAVDGEWKSWGNAVRGLANGTLQLGRTAVPWKTELPPEDSVFRMRYQGNGDPLTLLPLSAFVSDFLGVLDVHAPGGGSKNPLSYAYSLRRATALTREGQSKRVRPLRYGDPMIEALTRFCEHDDRGRVFSMWRRWPDYTPNDASGHDLFFRFDFLVEAGLPDGSEDAGGHALTRRLDACFPPIFITVWTTADGFIVEDPSTHLTAVYRTENGVPGSGRDFNLNPKRWQDLAIRQDLPWMQDWESTCMRNQAAALAYVQSLPTFQQRKAIARRLVSEQLKTQDVRLKNRIERLSGSARRSEELELDAEISRHWLLMAAVSEPRVRLDVVGAVFLSTDSLDD